MGLDGVHVLGHLELQQAGGLDLAGDDAGVAVGRDVEAGAGRTGIARPAHEDDVGVGLDLGEDHRVVGVDDEDQLGIGRQLGLGVDDQVEVALVGGVRGLAVVAAVLHGNAGLGAVLRPSLAIGGVAGKGDLAHVGAISGVRTVLQGDGHVGDGVAGLGAEHARRALDAVVGVLRVLDLDDGVLDVGEVLGSGAGDVALLVLGLGLALKRSARGVAHGVGHDIEVLGRDLGVKAGGDAGRRGAHEAGGAGSEDLRDVDLGLVGDAALGDDVARVLQHDDALVVAVRGKLCRGVAGEDGLCRIAVGVGLIEELGVDHQLEDAAGGLAHALQGGVLAHVLLHVLVDGVTDLLGVEAAAVLVDGAVDHHAIALLLRHVLGAAAGGDDAPVGGVHAVPAGVAQDGELGLVEAAAHALAVLGVLGERDAVVGHHGRHLLGLGVELHAAVKERDEVGLVVVAGEDVELAGVAVVVAAALDGAGAHEVLEHDTDGVLAPALVVGGLVVAPGGLHAAAEGAREVTGEGRVLGLGAVQAGDRRVGVEVDLGAKLAADPNGAPGASDPHARLAPEVLVHGGGQADGGGNAQRGVRVNGADVRDAVRALLALGLDVVDPGDDGGVGVAIAAQARNACAGALVKQARVVGVDLGAGRVHDALDAAVPHELDALLAGELAREVRGAVVGALAPVLEEAELAVAVHVAEGVAVDLDDACLVGNADGGAAVLVGHARPAVTNLLAGPLGGSALLVGLDGVLVGGRSGKRVGGSGGGAIGAAAGKAHQARSQRGSGEKTPA